MRSIGVSNFGVAHLRELLDSPLTTVLPAANEVELHPFLRKDDIHAFCSEHGIRLIAYSPLARAMRLDHPTLTVVAERHQVSVAQGGPGGTRNTSATLTSATLTSATLTSATQTSANLCT